MQIDDNQLRQLWFEHVEPTLINFQVALEAHTAEMKKQNELRGTKNESVYNVSRIINNLQHFLRKYDVKTTNWKDWNITREELEKVLTYSGANKEGDPNVTS